MMATNTAAFVGTPKTHEYKDPDILALGPDTMGMKETMACRILTFNELAQQ